VKALTVQQPWAWAIVHGGKDVENRTQAWAHRGPLAIHARARISERGLRDVDWLLAPGTVAPERDELVRGAIIGTVYLAGAHVAQTGCCDSAWAETSYDEHGGRTRRDVVHLELANPRPLAEPVPCKGRLGLWTPPADVLDQLQAVGR